MGGPSLTASFDVIASSRAVRSVPSVVFFSRSSALLSDVRNRNFVFDLGDFIPIFIFRLSPRASQNYPLSVFDLSHIINNSLEFSLYRLIINISGLDISAF
jgi:hypothetical protein